MTSHSEISDEAVEAAWRSALANDSLRSLWRNADEEWREAYKETLRRTLEAAAPFIAAQAWDECNATDTPRVNPYRISE